MDKGKRPPKKGNEEYRQTDSNSETNLSSSSTLPTPKPLTQLRNNLNSILNRLGSDLQCEVLPSDEDTLHDLTDSPLNNVTSSTTHSLTDDLSKSEEYSKKIPNTALQEENMAKSYRKDSKRNTVPTQSDLIGMKKTNNSSEIDNNRPYLVLCGGGSTNITSSESMSTPQPGRKGDEALPAVKTHHTTVSVRQRGGGDSCVCNQAEAGKPSPNCYCSDKQSSQKNNKAKCSCAPPLADCNSFVEYDGPSCNHSVKSTVKPTKELQWKSHSCKCGKREPPVQPVEGYQCICSQKLPAHKCDCKEQPVEEYQCVCCQKSPPCKCGQEEHKAQQVEESEYPCKCGQKELSLQPIEEYQCVCCQKSPPCKCGQTEGERFVPVHVRPLEEFHSSSDACHLIAEEDPCPCPKLSMKTRLFNALNLAKPAKAAGHSKHKDPQRNSSDIPTRLVFDLVEGIPEKDDSSSDQEEKKKKKRKVEKKPRQAKIRAEEFYINDPEKIDVYYFDHGNSGYYRTTDRPPHLMTELLMEQTSYYATKFWAEVFGTLHLIFSFFTAFLLQLLRFILYSIFRPLFVGLFQLGSDYFFKPILTIFFNGVVQPILILFYNIATSIRDMCEPIATTIGFFLTQLAIPVGAARLVEINNTTLAEGALGRVMDQRNRKDTKKDSTSTPPSKIPKIIVTPPTPERVARSMSEPSIFQRLFKKRDK